MGLLTLSTPVLHRHLHIMATMWTTNCRLKVVGISKKIVHIDTDIKFLQKCKKAEKTPKGLQIINPLKSTYNTDYTDRLCCHTSHKLLNHLIHQLYNMHCNLEIEIEPIFSACAQDTAAQLRDTAKQVRQWSYATYIHNKRKKLEKLGITTSSNQAFSGTTVERADTEEFIRRKGIREFFHKRQGVNCEPNGTTKEPEQSTRRSIVQRPKKRELNWTPPEGRCPRLDMCAQAVRRCINTRLISPTHEVAQNVTQAQRNTTRALKTNSNIVIKPADKGGSIVIQKSMDYCKD
eukprot:g26203.t1